MFIVISLKPDIRSYINVYIFGIGGCLSFSNVSSSSWYVDTDRIVMQDLHAGDFEDST